MYKQINESFLLPNQDLELVAQKREIVQNKPKKVNIGPTCPVCDLTFTKSQNRDHVAWHFMDEFREFVAQTGNERACQLCYYTTEKPDNLVSGKTNFFPFYVSLSNCYGTILSGLVTFTRRRCKCVRALYFTLSVFCTIIISCSL